MVYPGAGLVARAMGTETVVRPAIAPFFAPGLPLANAALEDAGETGDDLPGKISQLIPQSIAEGIMSDFAGFPKNSFLARASTQASFLQELELDDQDDQYLVFTDHVENNSVENKSANDQHSQYKHHNQNNPLSPAIPSVISEVIASNTTIDFTVDPVDPVDPSEKKSPQQYQPLLPIPASSLAEVRVNPINLPGQFSENPGLEGRTSLFSGTLLPTPISALSIPDFSPPNPQIPYPQIPSKTPTQPNLIAEIQSESSHQNSNRKESPNPTSNTTQNSQPLLTELKQPIVEKSVIPFSSQPSLFPIPDQSQSKLAIAPSSPETIEVPARKAASPPSKTDGNLVESDAREIGLPQRSVAIASPSTPAHPTPSPTPPNPVSTPITPRISTSPAPLSPPTSPTSPTSLPPTIQITIGRIEIRTTPRSTPARSTSPSKPQVSLQDYLKQRNQKD